MITNRGIHRIALITSLVIHIIFIVLFRFQFNKPEIPSPPDTEPVPIDYVVKEIIIEKPAPLKKVIPKKPTRLPGDRKQSVVKSSQEPFYPKDAINFGWEGTVKVKISVNTQGYASNVRIIKSSGFESLDNAFIDTIMASYTFKPKRVMGVNKVDTIIVSYTFKQ